MYDIVIFPLNCGWGILLTSGHRRSFDKYRSCDSRKQKPVKLPKVSSVGFYPEERVVFILTAADMKTCGFYFLVLNIGSTIIRVTEQWKNTVMDVLC